MPSEAWHFHILHILQRPSSCRGLGRATAGRARAPRPAGAGATNSNQSHCCWSPRRRRKGRQGARPCTWSRLAAATLSQGPSVPGASKTPFSPLTSEGGNGSGRLPTAAQRKRRPESVRSRRVVPRATGPAPWRQAPPPDDKPRLRPPALPTSSRRHGWAVDLVGFWDGLYLRRLSCPYSS